MLNIEARAKTSSLKCYIASHEECLHGPVLKKLFESHIPDNTNLLISKKDIEENLPVVHQINRKLAGKSEPRQQENIF